MIEIIVYLNDGQIKEAYDNYSLAFRKAEKNLNYDKSYSTFKRYFRNNREMQLENGCLVKTILIKSKRGCHDRKQ